MINFFKNIFIWWHRQTLGTMLYTLFFGKFKGSDEFGNKYYESKLGKRWVIYTSEINASKISNDWYSWIHFLNNNIPNIEKINKNKYFWEKKRKQNLTGTSETYRPKKISENKNIKKKYETWKI